jgi:hypothetical protein
MKPKASGVDLSDTRTPIFALVAPQDASTKTDTKANAQHNTAKNLLNIFFIFLFLHVFYNFSIRCNYLANIFDL